MIFMFHHRNYLIKRAGNATIASSPFCYSMVIHILSPLALAASILVIS